MESDHLTLPWTGARSGTPTIYGPRGALEFVRQFGLALPSGVRIVVMDSAVDAIAGPKATATWGAWGGTPDALVTWDAMTRSQFAGDIVLFIRREVLGNDEAILAIFGHEFHELSEFKRLIDEKAGALTIAEMTAYFGVPCGTVHLEAVKVGDALVRTLRKARGAS